MSSIQYGRARRVIGAVLVAGFAFAGGAAAQDKYPSRPIEFVVPWGPGGGADQLARKIGKMMEETLKVSIPVVNVAGATGATGMAKMLADPAEGYSMSVYIADTHALLATSTPRFQPQDFTPLAIMIRQPSGLFVAANSPIKNWADFEKEAKANPGKLKVAVLGLGSVDDITLRYFATKGIRTNPVPFANPGERYTSVVGGHADLLFEQAGDVKSLLDSKQIRPILFLANQRVAEFPDVPASKELGHDITLPQFRSIIVKAGTPPDRVKLLGDAIAKAAATADYKAWLKEQIADPASFIGVDQASQFMNGELAALKKFFDMTK